MRGNLSSSGLYRAPVRHLSPANHVFSCNFFLIKLWCSLTTYSHPHILSLKKSLKSPKYITSPNTSKNNNNKPIAYKSSDFQLCIYIGVVGNGGHQISRVDSAGRVGGTGIVWYVFLWLPYLEVWLIAHGQHPYFSHCRSLPTGFPTSSPILLNVISTNQLMSYLACWVAFVNAILIPVKSFRFSPPPWRLPKFLRKLKKPATSVLTSPYLLVPSLCIPWPSPFLAQMLFCSNIHSFLKDVSHFFRAFAKPALPGWLLLYLTWPNRLLNFLLLKFFSRSLPPCGLLWPVKFFRSLLLALTSSWFL